MCAHGHSTGRICLSNIIIMVRGCARNPLPSVLCAMKNHDFLSPLLSSRPSETPGNPRKPQGNPAGNPSETLPGTLPEPPFTPQNKYMEALPMLHSMHFSCWHKLRQQKSSSSSLRILAMRVSCGYTSPHFLTSHSVDSLPSPPTQLRKPPSLRAFANLMCSRAC